MKTILKVFMLVAVVVAFAGCRTAPVYNVDHASVVSATGKTLQMKQVREAIIRAGGGLGWVMQEDKPGHVVGTLHLRTHMAKVGITYTTKYYSIDYLDSENLNYDGTNIHSNYNGWVQRLQQGISAEISRE